MTVKKVLDNANQQNIPCSTFVALHELAKEIKEKPFPDLTVATKYIYDIFNPYIAFSLCCIDTINAFAVLCFANLCTSSQYIARFKCKPAWKHKHRMGGLQKTSSSPLILN